MQAVLADEPKLRSRSPEELAALRKTAERRVRTELGTAIALAYLGDVVMIEYLEKELTILDRLEDMIARLYNKLAYVRAIKSMAPPLLENAA